MNMHQVLDKVGGMTCLWSRTHGPSESDSESDSESVTSSWSPSRTVGVRVGELFTATGRDYHDRHHHQYDLYTFKSIAVSAVITHLVCTLAARRAALAMNLA